MAEEESRQLSLEFGRRSIALDDTDSLAHALFGEILFDCDQPKQAEHHFRKALALNPNDIAARALYASKLRSMERIDEALEHISIAKRLDPFSLLWVPLIEGSILFAAGRYEDAANAIYAMTVPPNEARFILIAALGRLGRMDEARQVRADFLSLARTEMPHFPGERLDDWTAVFSRFLSAPNEVVLESMLESLRLAGWK